MNMNHMCITSVSAVLLLGACSNQQSRQDAQAASRMESQHIAFVDHVLNTWHHDASSGRFDAYFDAMTNQAVFLGTDATERWTKEEFMNYAREPFSDGEGWTYHPVQRFVAVDETGDTAWVDEVLSHDRYGTLRGTAVMQHVDGEWKIAHYSLTFLVPNEKAGDVVRLIAEDSDG